MIMRKYCNICGTYKVRKKGKDKWRTICDACHTKPWTRYKLDKCEHCGFVPLHPCQLDVDHIDGNKSNNLSCNLMTLCANCHRLKTHINKDFSND